MLRGVKRDFGRMDIGLETKDKRLWEEGHETKD